MSTESIDPRYLELDRWPTETAIEAMLEAQLAAVATLQSQTNLLAAAADAAAARLRDGGRLIYAGAGTSGRVAIQDGVELGPTYNWPDDRLELMLAGGADAMTRSQEGAEDDVDAAALALEANNCGERDVLIAVAASGRTPYTLAALTGAKSRGALTIGIANNPGSPLLVEAHHPILATTGSEVVAGSTRMKAGTAQKVALTLLSTAIMLRCGLIHKGMMVNMRVSNSKLLLRAQEMVATLASTDDNRARMALAAAGNDIKRAVLIACGLGMKDADERLNRAGGNLGEVLRGLRGEGAA